MRTGQEDREEEFQFPEKSTITMSTNSCFIFIDGEKGKKETRIIDYHLYHKTLAVLPLLVRCVCLGIYCFCHWKLQPYSRCWGKRQGQEEEGLPEDTQKLHHWKEMKGKRSPWQEWKPSVKSAQSLKQTQVQLCTQSTGKADSYSGDRQGYIPTNAFKM